MNTAPDRRAVLRATVMVAISACCFGSISPLTVMALESGVALQGIQAWRYATTAVLFVLYAWWCPSPAPRISHDALGTPVARWYTPGVLLIAGGGQATVAALALTALRWIPAATAAFLFYTYPAWVAILTAVRGTERLDRVRIAALVLALGGIGAMVGAPDTASLHPLGLITILGGAIFYAAYIPVLGSLQLTRAPIDVARAVSVGGAIVFVSWALATNALFAHFDTRALFASVLQGVLSTGALLGFLAGLSALGAVRTAITSTIEPFWTTMLGVVLLGQPIGTGTVVGGVAIMVAVLLLQRPSVPLATLDSSSAHGADHTGRPNT